MTKRLRIVVFTAGQMTAIDRVLYERLASDPLIDFAGIVVDEYRPRPKPLATRIARAIREDGAAWIAFKIAARTRAIFNRMSRRVADAIHGPQRASAPLRVPVHHVADIHAADSIALIQTLQPELGVIVGGRILRDSVISIPAIGTLNIHKRKLPHYRGGGPVGYWEILAGEREIGVSIHHATAQVDAGPVVAESAIPIEERDTLESLKLKADLRGTQLYYDAIRRIASGDLSAVTQDLSQGTTYRAPSECKVWQLERRLKAKCADRLQPVDRLKPLRALRVLLQFFLLLPLLQRVRRRLVCEGRAPIAIFFYHLATNRVVNHMCLPLVEFARQIEFLQRYYSVLPLDESVARLRSGANDAVAASVTFDDGYRDNAWAIEYLRYFNIPATFFISIGHVLDGSTFEHDRRKGFHDALPMTVDDVRGLTVGSHAVHHEDLGGLDAPTADRVLRESREQIAQACGVTPQHFAFPKGQRGTNITRAGLEAATEHYDAVFSAYGGYAFPNPRGRHFVRIPNPATLFEMNLAMSGYNGFRDCVAGNIWGAKTEHLDPATAARAQEIALIAASPEIVGGHSVQAQTLVNALQGEGRHMSWIPVDARFPRGLRWMRRVRYVRTVVNEALYIASLLRIARADVVHIFAASYWSFLLGPAPAIIAAKLFRKRVVLHYHSGEAEDHLTNSRSAAPLLRLADTLVVPSAYLQRVFASHGLDAEVIPNAVDTAAFRYRERVPLRPRFLSVRSLEAYYRIDNTIAAFAELKRRFPDATLTIAGCGSQERRLRQVADRVSGVHFIGRVDVKDLPALYDSHDIFLNSSVVDNQPVSILEAFAAGLPVVSTPTGDIASMLRNGAAGLLVEPNEPTAMATAVTRLLDDPALAAGLARNARTEAAGYEVDRVKARWIAIYANVPAPAEAPAAALGVTAS